MNVRHCNKDGKHKGRQVEAFCLEEACKKDRLLCFFCVFESHAGHSMAYLHKELKGPISNLSEQAHHNTHAEAKTSRERIESTFSKITEVLKHHMKAC